MCDLLKVIIVVQVTPIDVRFYGTYKCTARNIHGEVWHEIKLQEAHVPSEVLQALLDVVTGKFHGF